jgi:hypothetical protein
LVEVADSLSACLDETFEHGNDAVKEGCSCEDCHGVVVKVSTGLGVGQSVAAFASEATVEAAKDSD